MEGAGPPADDDSQDDLLALLEAEMADDGAVDALERHVDAGPLLCMSVVHRAAGDRGAGHPFTGSCACALCSLLQR